MFASQCGLGYMLMNGIELQSTACAASPSAN